MENKAARRLLGTGSLGGGSRWCCQSHHLRLVAEPDHKSEAAAASDGTGQKDGVQRQLAQLVPTYDPGVDSVETWSQKIKLLLFAWPETKLKELATRIVLNTKGSAFQKLQLHQSEISLGTSKVSRRSCLWWVALSVRWSWKNVSRLLRRLCIAVQKEDETADSFLARSDVAWTELLSKKMTLAELKTYIVLRGRRLSGEDKKRVLVESGAEGLGALEMSKVSICCR